MSRYSKEVEQYNIERVRAVMTVRPGITGNEIARFLESSKTAPLSLDPDYVRKLQKKIIGERTHRARNVNMNLRISEIQDKKRLIDERLWEESGNKSNPGVVRVMALKQLIENEEKILKMEMDSGFLERKLGTVEVQHVRKLSPEHLRAVVETMKLWGIVRKDEPEPIHATAQTYTSTPEPIHPVTALVPVPHDTSPAPTDALGDAGALGAD